MFKFKDKRARPKRHFRCCDSSRPDDDSFFNFVGRFSVFGSQTNVPIFLSSRAFCGRSSMRAWWECRWQFCCFIVKNYEFFPLIDFLFTQRPPEPVVGVSTQSFADDRWSVSASWKNRHRAQAQRRVVKTETERRRERRRKKKHK